MFSQLRKVRVFLLLPGSVVVVLAVVSQLVDLEAIVGVLGNLSLLL